MQTTICQKKAGQAVHVLDRFNIMVHFGKALNDVRAGEAKGYLLKEEFQQLWSYASPYRAVRFLDR